LELECLVSEIENQKSWQIALSQINEQIDILDNHWQDVSQDKFKEMQITKIGLMSVLGIVGSWKQELDNLKLELEARQNPDKIQVSDFDNE
jgi:uncharacterized protein with HEPN domain